MRVATAVVIGVVVGFVGGVVVARGAYKRPSSDPVHECPTTWTISDDSLVTWGPSA